MLNDFFSGIGFAILLLIALVISVIAIGFKVLFWVVGIILGCILVYAIIMASWYWICRFMAWALPAGSRSQMWFRRKINELS